MTALLSCLAVAVPFAALFFGIGAAYERTRQEPVVHVDRTRCHVHLLEERA